MTPADVKRCCAAAYSSEAVRWLVGDPLHPGGTGLTRRLVDALDVRPGDLVLDVASGTGTSALEVARATGADVVGVDISRENVRLATERAVAAGLTDRVTFLEGDAESLPLAPESVDGIICECSLCLFPDKERAAREFSRVLRRSGRLALSDVTADPDALPPELRTVSAATACIADARPLGEVAFILERAGLVVDELEDHSLLLADLLERVDKRLRVASLLGTAVPESVASALGEAVELVRAARDAVAAGALGYGAVYAARP